MGQTMFLINTIVWLMAGMLALVLVVRAFLRDLRISKIEKQIQKDQKRFVELCRKLEHGHTAPMRGE